MSEYEKSKEGLREMLKKAGVKSQLIHELMENYSRNVLQTQLLADCLIKDAEALEMLKMFEENIVSEQARLFQELKMCFQMDIQKKENNIFNFLVRTRLGSQRSAS